ncbi:hypothetical protein [Brachybacterium sp. J153]|uniref:hypothetical protein n=1 Tax=Brachybacterium sp. J153 TaxID=3116488 RepID=UPI002E782021|nr:hypothetical protein [Brachybacterium sp. J153]MEE1617324.1 hypothetical protein [Brachybacterium sp. J153]
MYFASPLTPPYPPYPMPWFADRESVELAPNLYAAQTSSGSAETEQRRPDGTVAFTVKTEVELVHFRYEVRSLAIETEHPGGISATFIRNYLVGDFASLGGRRSLAQLNEAGEWFSYRPFFRYEGPPLSPTDDVLKEVARIYACSYALSEKPTHRVEKGLNLKRSTAENWVRRAKDKGYIYAEA